MKKAIEELADRLENKYAQKSKRNQRCKCENKICDSMGLHEPTKCPNMSTGKVAKYFGPICDVCAEYLPQEYILEEDMEQLADDQDCSLDPIPELEDL